MNELETYYNHLRAFIERIEADRTILRALLAEAELTIRELADGADAGTQTPADVLARVER